MSATLSPTISGFPRLPALALVWVFTLSGCAEPGGRSPAAAEAAGCGESSACTAAVGMAEQVRLDTDAILAGMAHARARLGLQEDAAP